MTSTKNKLILHVMVGNIGTGKTVTTKRLMTELSDTLVVDIDPIVMMLGAGTYGPHMFTDCHRNLYGALLRTTVDHVLQHGFNVILDTTMMSKHHRADYIKIAKRYSATVKVYLHTTSGGLQRRCQDARGQTSETWKQVYEEFARIYETPSLDEGIDEIIDCTWEVPEIDKNYNYVIQNKDMLSKIYPNKYLVVVDQRVVDSFDTYERAAESGLINYGEGKFLVHYLTENAIIDCIG